MGLGACAIQTGGYTYFATVKSSRETEGSIEVVYNLDRRLERRIAGIRSALLTRAMEYICSNLYMKLENQQNLLLRLAVWIQKLFRIEVLFAEVPPMGEITVQYDVSDYEVTVDLCCKTGFNKCTLYVMNELGANFFNLGLKNGKLVPPPSGWQKLDGFCELCSSTYKLAFTVVEKHIPDYVRSSIYWGRELSAIHCWAGFESEIPFDNGYIDHYIYSVQFREVTV